MNVAFTTGFLLAAGFFLEFAFETFFTAAFGGFLLVAFDGFGVRFPCAFDFFRLSLLLLFFGVAFPFFVLALAFFTVPRCTLTAFFFGGREDEAGPFDGFCFLAAMQINASEKNSSHGENNEIDRHLISTI